MSLWILTGDQQRTAGNRHIFVLPPLAAGRAA
jgi:hypothetical protein